MCDADEPLSWIETELADWASRGLQRHRAACDARHGACVTTAGRRLVNFGSNDYLNLATDARVVAAVRATIDEFGWGAGASPLVTGFSKWHEQLERRLAQFKNCSAALLFSSGFAANSGTIGAIIGRGDVVFSDEHNHASLIDGCRLAKANIVVYPHCDWRQLDALMGEAGDARRRLIVTDTVFSMGGDTAPLIELAEIAERRGAMLMVDEAHAMGVFGRRGSGLAESLDVEGRVAVRVGTLSKAVGSIGGFVAGSGSLIDWLQNRARPYVFSTAIPAAAAAAACAAIDIIESSADARMNLLAKADCLRAALSARGWNVGRSCSQIVPVYVGESERAMRLSRALSHRGFWCPGIRPPSVSEGNALLRISLTSQHSDAMITELVHAIDDCRNV